MTGKSASDDASPFDDAELYDLILGNLTYGIDFYVGLARQARGPLLDIACGTGRVLIPCLQAGADVDGLDLSEAMLARLRKKAGALGFAPTVVQGDMGDFQLPRCYALIMITFNAFIHNMTQASQLRCLEKCRQHLLPGGVLAFDTFFPSLAIIGAPEGKRVLELEIAHPATGRPLRLFDTRTFNRVEQTQHSVNDIETEDAQGRPVLLQHSAFTTRWVYREEMSLLLRLAGFPRWEICGGFDRRPLTKETDSMVVLAWND